ncbi:MAG: hypothetical protein N4A48_03935 [Tepidibacter sp.]|uniref:hypothetical protein n=1 Tax=Tepidibacter sp. TaxID=2529387 RepID=UPI0025DD6C73|nr:hypothetical protein [Tepidibacter sp.]MCT4507899.1 hypothetical protein [Tepidibacter sp.]MCT4606874.1 hypothetical protein [Marinisporobacter sp.]
MKNTRKRALGIALSIFLLCSSTSIAHRGRTDGSGGHHDYKNKSGLGSYHYHCGGYSAHLHKNGVCPYKSNKTTTHIKKSTAPKAPVVNPNIRSVYVPSYTIKVNNSVVNNQYCKYPFFSYNNIVYLPLTWEHGQYLGFYANMDDSKRLNVAITNKIDNTKPLSLNNKAHNSKVSQEAFKTNSNILINNEVVYDDADYPFLSYNGITYVPLTSNIATKLNLQVQWNDQTGFSVNRLAKQ